MRIHTPPSATLVPEHAKKVFVGKIFDVYQWEQEMFDGSTKTFEMIKRPDTVEIIPIHEEMIILGKETQPHTGEFISVPAGMHDLDGENELEAAKRELLEETGYSFKNWKLIEARQAGSNKIEQMIYTFLATDLDEIKAQNLDADGEKIEVVQMSFEEMKKRKNDPIMRFYPHSILGDLTSLEELLVLPAVHDYGN